MTFWRLGLLVLPQVGVVRAYGTFHAAATDASTAAVAASRFGMLAESMGVIIAGWMVVACNLLIAAALLRYAAKRDVRAVRWREGRPAAPSPTRSTLAGLAADGSGSSRSASRVCPLLVWTTPFDRVTPRRADSGPGRP